MNEARQRTYVMIKSYPMSKEENCNNILIKEYTNCDEDVTKE